MLDRLTEKEAGFVKDVMSGKTPTEAVRRNYNVTTESSATSLATTMMDKPKIDARLTRIADRIPDDLLVRKHTAMLEKMKGKEIDTNAVSKGLDMAYKIKGLYGTENVGVTNIGMVLVKFINGKENTNDIDTRGVQEAV